MSRKTYVAIVGNGKTTRSNVEALIGDFSEAIDDLTLIIQVKPESEEATTEGSTWVLQYAEAHEIKKHLVENVYQFIDGSLDTDKDEIKFFMLWDDDDVACQSAVNYAQMHSIPVFDLTDGLIRISLDDVIVDAPEEVTMPESEMHVKEDTEPLPSHAFIPPKESIFEAIQEPLLDWADEDEDEDDEYDENLAGAELIAAALEEAGRILASSFVAEMIRLLRGDKSDEAE